MWCWVLVAKSLGLKGEECLSAPPHLHHPPHLPCWAKPTGLPHALGARSELSMPIAYGKTYENEPMLLSAIEGAVKKIHQNKEHQTDLLQIDLLNWL